MPFDIGSPAHLVEPLDQFARSPETEQNADGMNYEEISSISGILS